MYAISHAIHTAHPTDERSVGAEAFERTETISAAPRRTGRSASHCWVCGFAEIRTDAAFDGEHVLLAECPRCESRWTAPFEPGTDAQRDAATASRRAMRRVERVAPAA